MLHKGRNLAIKSPALCLQLPACGEDDATTAVSACVGSSRQMLSHKMKWKDSYIEAVDRGQTVFNKTFSIDTKYDKRIDYIMHRGSNSVETKSTNYNVLHEKLDMGHSILNMSDHYFILSDIEFSES